MPKINFDNDGMVISNSKNEPLFGKEEEANLSMINKNNSVNSIGSIDDSIGTVSTSILNEMNKDGEIKAETDSEFDDYSMGSIIDMLEGDTTKSATDNEEEIKKKKEKEALIKEKINSAKKFYSVYDYQINLNHESFVKFSKIENFVIGFRYKNKIDKLNNVELMCQIINEKLKIKYVCKRVYFYETSLKLDDSKNNLLIGKYLGKRMIKGFKEELVLELKEYFWFLKIYHNRFNYVKECLEKRLNFSLGDLKSIKTYDDVYEYFSINVHLI